MLSRRSAVIVTAIGSLALGGAAVPVVSWVVEDDRVPPIEGTARIAAISNAGEVVAFDKDSEVTRLPGVDLPSHTYSVADVSWQDADGTWHEGTPDCLREGDEVRVGVVHTEATEHGPGRSLLAYVRCSA